MKIGILTQPLGHNYGGLLQNWALQQYLMSEGHDVFTINQMTYFIWVRNVFAYLYKHLTFHPTRKDNKLPFQYAPHNNLHKFLQKKIKQTYFIKNINANTICKKGFDAIIVGSDQVWRPKYNTDLNLMFCESKNTSKSLLKIAFSASFGTDVWEFSQSQTIMAKKAIQDFKRVSVREESGINLCKTYLNYDAVHTLDPTFLLSASDYDKLIPEKILKDKRTAICCYFLNNTDYKKKITNEIAEELNLPLHHTGVLNLNKQIDSIEEWLASIKNSDFIITDSFHGTVFSIIYNKSFITFSNESRGNARFKSLLNSLGLENRLVDYRFPTDVKRILNEEIKWEKVNNQLSKLREESIIFLKEALKK